MKGRKLRKKDERKGMNWREEDEIKEKQPNQNQNFFWGGAKSMHRVYG